MADERSAIDGSATPSEAQPVSPMPRPADDDPPLKPNDPAGKELTSPDDTKGG